MKISTFLLVAAVVAFVGSQFWLFWGNIPLYLLQLLIASYFAHCADVSKEREALRTPVGQAQR